MLQISPPGVPTFSVFLPARYRVVLVGNSPTSSGFILKMNNGYNGVSIELEKFTK
jgi:hypothetical protein